MIAYNPVSLNNLFIIKQAREAYHNNCLEKNEVDLIIDKYPVQFYSTNFFIRIGLFILTTIIIFFSFGIVALLMLDSIDHAIGGLAIFFGLLTYAALEYMVQTKKHFQSGVDDALLWISSGAFFGGIAILLNSGELANCWIVLFISLYATLRFADRLMSILIFASLLGIFFFTIIKMGPLARAILPFVIMAFSVSIYLLVKWMKQLKFSPVYFDCLQILTISALLSFYFSGNYYVVRELNNMLFNINPLAKEGIPMGWFFWIFTVLIPCLYLLVGIKKNDIILIRVGLLLIAVIIFTVRYYFSILPIEGVMTIGGMALIIVSYGLTRYLKSHKFGYTNLQLDSAAAKGLLQMESILQLQSFTTQQGSTTDATKFGGGSFGGGGGSGQY